MKSARPTPLPVARPTPTCDRLGERVRMLRNQRGMTRKALAQHAKVSERYLAQLEAGLGNGSIILLRRIARAIGLPVTQLVQEGAEPAARSWFCCRSSSSDCRHRQLVEARNMLLKSFSAPSEDARAQTNCTHWIARRRQIDLGRIAGGTARAFPLSSSTARSNDAAAPLERDFRHVRAGDLPPRRARSARRCLREHPSFVIATSGSIVTEPARSNAACLLPHRVGPRRTAEHMKRVMAQGDMRPMANSTRAMDDLISILRSREPLYAKAEVALSTTGKTPERRWRNCCVLIAVPANRMTRRKLA